MKLVANSESVISHFGYWPTYADGTVLRFALEPAAIELSIRYGDTATHRSGEVDLRFEGVTHVELNEVREQNVLDEMALTAGSPIQVRLEAAYGLYGSFTCKSVAVLSFRPSSHEL